MEEQVSPLVHRIPCRLPLKLADKVSRYFLGCSYRLQLALNAQKAMEAEEGAPKGSGIGWQDAKAGSGKSESKGDAKVVCPSSARACFPI